VRHRWFLVLGSGAAAGGALAVKRYSGRAGGVIPAAWHAGCVSAGMTDERDRDQNPPIDESTYGASSAESGGLYNRDGPTTANEEGDTMSEREERGGDTPDLPADG
jgi:hypothetical protein